MCSDIVQKQFLVLDQTLVVFDIEQPRNATQKIHINRLTGVGPIYWRFQTNAPTNYIVSPNTGLLDHDETVEVTITLYKNRFRPKHEMFLQATQAKANVTGPEIWQDSDNIQVIPLDLGTTVMNIEKAIENRKSAHKNVDLKQLLDRSATKGNKRVEELESILKMTKTDVEIIENNITEAKKLKGVLESQLVEKKTLANEFRSKLALIEGSYMRKSVEVERLRAELASSSSTDKKQTIASVPVEHTVNCLIA